MRGRCRNPNDRSYKSYGGRGIQVCPEWNDYEAFYKWCHENGIKDKLTIERIDNDGGYCPDNCKWATYTEQCHNTSRNVWITFDGISMIQEDWANLINITSSALKYRLDHWVLKDALTKPRHWRNA
jgi:hypothetical protein